MNKSMHAGASWVYETESSRATWFLFFAASIICHLIVFAVLLFSPTHNRKTVSPVINVDLIALTTPESSSEGSALMPKKDNTLKREIKVKQQKKADPIKTSVKSTEPVAEIARKPLKRVSVSSKNKQVKKSLKKKTFNPSKVVKTAVTRIEKTVEESRQQPIAAAIDRLKRQVKEREKTRGSSGKQTGDGRPGSGAPGRHIRSRIEQIYQNEIMYHIQKNWAFSEQLAGGRTDDLRVALGIKIMPNGEIREIWFDKRSGNSYFDESAYKAVKKSNPLPPLPEEFSMPFYNIGFIFNPLGLE
jgi:colicin import membrane protein